MPSASVAPCRRWVPSNIGENIQVTVSIGIAEIDTTQESIESALARADGALYEAKESGRNRVCQAEPAMVYSIEALADCVGD